MSLVAVPSFEAAGRRFEFSGGVTHVMGVINLSPESHNRHTFAASPEEALAMARAYRQAGASMVDLGAQSSHYDNPELSAEEEGDRLLPSLRALADDGFVVAVDTWKPAVAEAALAAGAAILNDTGGLQDPAMVEIVRRAGCPAVAMYIEATNPLRVGEMEFTETKAVDVAASLGARVASLAEQGITSLLLDPGLSISYRSDYRRYTLQQMQVIRGIGHLRALGHPVLIPVPRKREFPRVMAYVTLALEYGADVIRVHDVEAAADLVRLYGRTADEAGS